MKPNIAKSGVSSFGISCRSRSGFSRVVRESQKNTHISMRVNVFGLGENINAIPIKGRINFKCLLPDAQKIGRHYIPKIYSSLQRYAHPCHECSNQQLVKIKTEWLDGLAKWTHALTVTIRRRNERGYATNNDDVYLALKHFLRVLSCSCYGSRQTKKRHLLVPAIVVADRGICSDHPHAHLALAVPNGMSGDIFTKKIYAALEKTRMFNREKKLKPYKDSGWIRYMLGHGADRIFTEFLPYTSNSQG